MADSKKEKQKKNRARRKELMARSAIAYRRKQGLASNQDEADLASYFRRFGAFALDQVLFFFFYMFYSVIWISILGPEIGALIASMTSVFLFGLIYIVPKISRTGQTLGRRRMDIMVIRADGEGLLDFRSSLKRWSIEFALPATMAILVFLLLSRSELAVLAGLVNAIAIAIVILPVFKSPDRQGFHDKFAKSVVIRTLSK